ncbi:hypothetical protein E2C01_046803 [Portunus trituberculatus]|uniref:Uncharacterized protein n=1 Tax=Portunus trituberculatus TaxID=210409 RepID=A0A5B7G1X1_PORTR|nr:hypothetical protein [Portunus trituberculatus]
MFLFTCHSPRILSALTHNIHKKHAIRISLMFIRKRVKRLIVVLAARHDGATVWCKQNTSGYRINEFFLRQIESRVVITKHRNCEFTG